MLFQLERINEALQWARNLDVSSLNVDERMGKKYFLTA